MRGGYRFLPSELSSAIIRVLIPEEFDESGEVTLPGIYKELQQILALRKFCLLSPFNFMSQSAGLISSTAIPCSITTNAGSFLLTFLLGGGAISIVVDENDILRLLSDGG